MLLQSFSLIATYLVISISLASAIEISIYQQILRGETATVTGVKEEVSMDIDVLVDKRLEFVHDPSDFRWENVQVKIEAIGRNPLYPIKKIYLFKCKDSTPLDCVDYEPIEADSYLSGEKGTFYWRDVSRSNTANFLILIKFNYDGKDFWVGYWDQTKREGIESFRHTTYDISSLDIYAKPGIEPSWIKDFVQNYFMIPANWMDRAVLGPVNGRQTSEIYEIVADKAEIDASSFDKYRPSTNIIETVTKDFLIAFGKGSVSNPITFFSNQLPSCGAGSGACEVGENPDNCCLDCGCPTSSQQCSTSPTYPDGLCHVCGDGTLDPVENSTNCCADAGCPSGLDCNTAMNIPYGLCVTPQCGNAACEPSEDSSTCPTDCWNTPGKRCEDVLGSGYYYNQQLQACMLAECGKRGCEPGEDFSSCCLDCNTCPSGQYCDTDTIAAGVCTTPTCGNSDCETGEDYTNCCTDCRDCPADPFTGQLQVCTSNVCHLCGNGQIESPIETPLTCCQDAGCTSGYCSMGGSCKTESQMGYMVTILPETIDCTQGGDVDIRFTPVNGANFFNTYESIAYTYENSRYRLTQCVQQGDVYMCKLPLAGPETFPGCFNTGTKNVEFDILFTYFEDKSDVDSNNIKYAEVTVPFSFDVTKARQRTCNKNNACEPGIGETPDFCCWDCMCEGGNICTASNCKNESQITLVVNPEDLPAKNNIDCSPRNGMQPTGEFKFMAHVQNVPESAYDNFNVLNWKFDYNGKTYTAQNIPGFRCTEMIDQFGRHTGDVECTMPVSMFPACPNAPPASINLTLNVLGGGLRSHYAPYEGKPLSAQFSLDYVQGLPLCGNGDPNPELGETPDSCCRDVGCPSGKVCTLYSGCANQNEVDLSVTMTPSTIDCTREPASTRGRNNVIILAEAVKKPYSPETGGIEFGDAYLGDFRIEEMGGVCEPVVNSTAYSVYGWRCTIPYDNFNPFCWEAGSHEVPFETTMTWNDRLGNRITNRIIKNLTFSISPPRERRCIPDGSLDPELGEMLDQCCPDAGCSGDNVCTTDIACVNPSQVDLITDGVSPATIDCSNNNEDNKVIIKVHFQNKPYRTTYMEWYVEYPYGSGNIFTEQQHFTCTPTMMFGGIQSDTSYTCEIPIYKFPACATTGSKTLGLTARMLYSDYRGQLFHQDLNTTFTVNVGTAGLPNCATGIGAGVCDGSLGETTANCCQDCGCASEDGICSQDGSCYTEDELSMTVSPTPQTAKCQLSYYEIDYESYSVKNYLCNFQESVDLTANLNHKPYNARVSSSTFVWDGDETFSDLINIGEPTVYGWELGFMPNPSGSYVVEMFVGDQKTSAHTMSGISLTVEPLTTTDTYSKIANVRSTNNVVINVIEEKGEDLLEMERALEAAMRASEEAKTYMCTIMTLISICTLCSLMSGGVVHAMAEEHADSLKYTVNTANGDMQYTYEAGVSGNPGNWGQGKGTSRTRLYNAQAIANLNSQRTSTINSYVQSQTGTTPGQSNSGNVMDLFTTLAGSFGGVGKVGSGIAGALTGLVFVWVMSDLDCGTGYQAAVLAGMAVCTGILISSPAIMIKIAKVCNFLSMALKLIMLSNKLRAMSMSHQGCMVQAATTLSTRPQADETPAQRTQRIASHWNQQAACQNQMAGNLNSFMTSLGTTFRTTPTGATIPTSTVTSSGYGLSAGTQNPWKTDIDLSTATSKQLTFSYNFHPNTDPGKIYFKLQSNWVETDGSPAGQTTDSEYFEFNRLAPRGTITCTLKELTKEKNYNLFCTNQMINIDVNVVKPLYNNRANKLSSLKMVIQWTRCPTGSLCTQSYDVIMTGGAAATMGVITNGNGQNGAIACGSRSTCPDCYRVQGCEWSLEWSTGNPQCVGDGAAGFFDRTIACPDNDKFSVLDCDGMNDINGIDSANKCRICLQTRSPTVGNCVWVDFPTGHQTPDGCYSDLADDAITAAGVKKYVCSSDTTEV
jgi:hypothetical protein